MSITTKLLTILLIVGVISFQRASGQCSLITANGSSQDPKTVCSPVDFTMKVWYRFLIPIDPAKVEIEFVWNDGTGATTRVPGNWNASFDSIWASASHLYPPSGECSRTADAYLIYEGSRCTSSGHQEQTFSTWGTDEENGGVLSINPQVHYVCEGEDVVNVRFNDNSTFNCNIYMEPDNPNQYYRWVQFIYGTYNQGGDRIPNVTINDGSNSFSMTDGAGSNLGERRGPIVRIPIPANGPNQISYPISAPAGGVAGDIFEITLLNWNVCNPYDNIPTDGNPPADLVNGDNAPIITTARIEIVAPPPLTTQAFVEYCTYEDIVLSANASGAEIRWYSDAGLTNRLHTGTSYRPSNAPYSLDNSVAGNHRFYVSSYNGMCESAPSIVDLVIYQSPNQSLAGPNMLICADTISLQANNPSVGTGTWTTSSSANISNNTSPTSFVSSLRHGPNYFTWTISNGPCSTSDEVIITSDRRPDPANAGIDQSYCDPAAIPLSADVPTNGATGEWHLLNGLGSIINTEDAVTTYNNPSQGMNSLAWRITSRYGGCSGSIDTVSFLVDRPPGQADAGLDFRTCELADESLSAVPVANNGTGFWSVFQGTAIIDNPMDPQSAVSGLSLGDNSFIWLVESQYGICTPSEDTVTLTQDEGPGIANAGSDIFHCLILQDTLKANMPTLGTGRWNVVSTPNGVMPSFSPNIFNPNAQVSILPGNEGRYLLEWNLINGSCTTKDTMAIDFGIPPPPSNAGIDSTVCGTDYRLQGNNFTKGNNSWSLVSGPSEVIWIPDSSRFNAFIRSDASFPGAYQFEWKLSSGNCPPTLDTVLIRFNKIPDDPLVPGATSCGPDSILLNVNNVETGIIYNWYHTTTETVPFRNGTSYKTPMIISDRNYYTQAVDSSTLCSSDKTESAITIYPVPDNAIIYGDTLCGGGNATLVAGSISPGTIINWYSDREQLDKIETGELLQTDSLMMSDWFFANALDTLTSCVSSIDSAYVNVWPQIPDPSVGGDSICGEGSLVLYGFKSDPGNLIFWYDSLTDGTLLQINDSFQTPTLNETVNYWIAEYNPSTGCFSERSLVQAKINAVPQNPVIADESSCGAASFILKPVGDSFTRQFLWYDLPINSTPIALSDSIETPFLTSNKSYWVSGKNNITGCEGEREQVDIAIHPLPGSLDIIGPTVVLKDQSNVIFSTNGQAGSIFSWDIPTEINLEANMNDFVRLGFPETGDFTISSRETTANACPGSVTYHPIKVINDSLLVDIGSFDQHACTQFDYEIEPWLFGGTPPYTYRWSGDIEYLSVTNSLFTTFSPPGVGSYRLFLEVADVNLKYAKDSVTIIVHESPVTSITNTEEVVCIGDMLGIQTESTGEQPFMHNWAGNIRDLNSYSIANPVFEPKQADTSWFWYTLIDANGCYAYDSISFISDKPTANFKVLTEPGCSPLPVDFENTSTGAVSYQWLFGDGSSRNVFNPSYTYRNNSPEIKYFDVELEVESTLGCRDKTKEYVMVWPNPVATINVLPEKGCNPVNALLVSTPGNSVYTWDFGDGNMEKNNRFNMSHLFVNEGLNDTVYQLSVITQSSLECYDTARANITVYAKPNAAFDLSPAVQEYPESSFEVDNETMGNWDFQWNFGNGNFSQENQPGSIAYDAPGNYTISLVASSNYCSDSASHTAYLEPAPPIANFKGADPGCMPHTITMINNSEYADSYLWEFGDGSISTAKEPSYTYYQAGKYKINLTVRGDGGESSFSDTTSVYILPNSYFDLAPRYVYVNDEAVHYFNLSDHGRVFEWNFGDGNTSDELNPKHIYKEAGNFEVTLKVWTENGCFDLFIMENAVMVEPSGVVEFPNAFRPNSPIDENRVFKPGIIDHVDNYHLMIFNRWGELIFESFDQETGWDGMYKGNLAKQDVYVWKVKGNYSDGKGFVKSGDVTLLY